jgi:hypothetical protein
MIHLSWYTFLGMSEKGEDESFRAHEMAHQWFGIGVEPASERDAWLSEGFSEFAGMWYMQLILQDNDKYFKMLRVRAPDPQPARQGDAARVGLPGDGELERRVQPHDISERRLGPAHVAQPDDRQPYHE